MLPHQAVVEAVDFALDWAVVASDKHAIVLRSGKVHALRWLLTIKFLH